MRDKGFLVIAGCMVLAACAAFPKTDQRTMRQPESNAPGEQFTEQELRALYYYDLGPDKIDVSTYPKGFREGYEVFARSCSQCHTLARPINSPRESYIAWKFYVFEMRLASKVKPVPGFTKEEAQTIVDFLTYDSMIRKDIHRPEFEALSKQLQNRFDHILAEHLRRLQQIPLRRKAQ